MDAYCNCIHINKNNCKKILFFYIDEFLINDSYNIIIYKFLENPRYKKFAEISVNWILFLDNNLLTYQDLVVINIFKGIKKN